jgi:hypothetical protein
VVEFAKGGITAEALVTVAHHRAAFREVFATWSSRKDARRGRERNAAITNSRAGFGAKFKGHPPPGRL